MSEENQNLDPAEQSRVNEPINEGETVNASPLAPSDPPPAMQPPQTTVLPESVSPLQQQPQPQVLHQNQYPGQTQPPEQPQQGYQMPQQQSFPAPGQPQAQWLQGMQPAPQKTNTLAIISLVSAFFVSLLAIILGHISLSQIKKTGEGGRGLALTGTILGYVFTFGWLIVLGFLLIGSLILAPIANSTLENLPTESDDTSWMDELNSEDPWEAEEDDFFTGDTSNYPWAGTPHAAMCDLFISDEFMTDDEFNIEEIARQIYEVAPPSSKPVYEEIMNNAQNISSDDSAAEYSLINQLSEQIGEDIDLCWDF